jgi:HEAT repeat protein
MSSLLERCARLLGLLLGGLLLLAAAAAAQGDVEAVGEFKRHFRKFKDAATRTEAVLALREVDSPELVGLLGPLLVDPEPEVARAARSVLSELGSPASIAAVEQALLAATGATRAGWLEVAALGRFPLLPETVQKCLADKDWSVRRAALSALAAQGGDAALALPLAQDKEPAVRCAALEALAALKSELVLAPARAALQDEVWQVRASAAAALGRVRHKDSIEPLIARMESEEGRLVADYGKALSAITGRQFGERASAWRQFWTTYATRFEIPTDAQLAELRAKEAAANATYHAERAVNYHGIATPSRSILFVIDVSGSMENLVVERERFADGGYPSMARIDIVKTELARTIERLEGYVQFNILAFATDVRFWKKSLVAANALNKAGAADWVGRLEPLGGNSRADLAQAGLTAAAGLEAGKTNTYGALVAALGVAGRGARDASYQTAIDTIFFLSDGRPSHGTYVDTDDILREIRAANELRKVVLHTIAIGEFEKDFMRRLAEDSGGTFVDLGK